MSNKLSEKQKLSKLPLYGYRKHTIDDYVSYIPDNTLPYNIAKEL